MFVVPLTSADDNVLNDHTVEVQHEVLNQRDGLTIRTFAICDSGRWISLDHPALEYFRRRTKGNIGPIISITGDQLDNIIVRSMELMSGARRFRKYVNGGMKEIANRVKDSKEQSKRMVLRQSGMVGRSPSHRLDGASRSPVRMQLLPQQTKPRARKLVRD